MSYLFFWKPDDANGWCSNWYDAPFTIDEVQYKTSEHYMMAQKARLMGDEDSFQKIISDDCDHPKSAQALGRKVKNWDEQRWVDNRERIMDEALIAKFNTHEHLKQLLVHSHPKTLVEASPVDKIWGIGLNPQQASTNPNPAHWKGLNLLGQSLMRVRQAILQQQ
jgi:hypothetical protein